MKVLHVLHQFLPDYVGGTEVYVADLSRGLTRRGHQLALFTGGDTETRGEWEGLPLTQVVGGLRSPKGLTAGFLATFGNASTEQAYKEVLAAFRPDIVHVHHLLGLSARLIRQTKALGIPVCCTLHDYWFMCPKSQLIDHKGEPCDGPAGVNCARCAAERLGDGLYVAATIPAAPLFLLRERVVRRAYAAADRLLAPSHFLAGLAVQHGLPQEKLEVVEFGTMAAAAPERTPREAGSQLRVTYLGSLEWSKGVHVLVKAFRQLHPDQARLRIAGDTNAYPPYAGSLRGGAEGFPIEFLGAVPHDDVPALLADTDVLVVPSLWYENAPRVIAEAYAAGVPVVASRIGALAEKVSAGENGLLFTPDNAVELAQTLQRLIDDPVLLARLQGGATNAPSWDAHLDHMERVYGELTALQAAGALR